ncbi:hypothetical protein KHA80_13295 [Anaerobacillus sp. HL2]|nr:hypothetical protein KHA80_13295 [Anaerobacillus sp. HL2]
MNINKIEDMLTQLITIVGTMQADFQEMKIQMSQMQNQMNRLETRVGQLETKSDERHKRDYESI